MTVQAMRQLLTLNSDQVCSCGMTRILLLPNFPNTDRFTLSSHILKPYVHCTYHPTFSPTFHVRFPLKTICTTFDGLYSM